MLLMLSNNVNLVSIVATVALSACLGLSHLTAAELSPDDKTVIFLHEADLEGKVARLRTMSDADKRRALDAIHSNRSGLFDGALPSVLLFLGDREQRERAIADSRQQRFYMPELVALGEPWVIEELAPEMFREEAFDNYVQGDIINDPISYAVAGLIIANLQHSTIYSDEVLRWAERTNPYSFPQLRSAMRDWWRENEHSFATRNYLAVKPGREVELIEPVDKPPPINHPSGIKATPPPLAVIPPSPPLSPTQPRGESKGSFVAAAVALVLSLVGIVWLLYRKKSKS